MRKNIWKLFAGLMTILLALMSCTPSSGDTSGDDGDDKKTPATNTGNTVNLNLLSSIPDMGELLPQSLQAGGEANHNAETKNRAVGDVTNLDQSTLPGVTANGYLSVKSAMTDTQIQFLWKTLKAGIEAYEASGKTITTNNAVKLGTVTISADITGTGSEESADLGSIYVTDETDDATKKKFTTVKWHVNYADFDTYIYMEILGNDPETMYLTMAIDTDCEWSTTDVDGNVTESGTMNYKAAFSYDAVTKEMKTIELPSTSAGFAGRISSVAPKDGYINYYSLSTGYKQVAYANDTIGGIVNAYSSTFTNPYTNITSTIKGINTEFYDESGDLLMTQWGTNQDNSSSYTYMFNDSENIYSLFPSLSAAPTTLQKKITYNSESEEIIEWSADNGTTWVSGTTTNKTGAGFYPVWQAGTTLATGDTAYYYSGYESNTTEMTFIYKYTVGYTVKPAQTFLGSSYFMQNTFTLKHLTLDVDPTSDYVIRATEGETYYSYEDPETGEWTSATTQPSYWSTLSSYDKNSYTSYSYKLYNKVLDKESDISGLSEDKFYIWDNGNNKLVKTHVVNSTEEEPVGFTFADKDNVTAIKSKIEAYYTSDVPDFNASTLQTDFNEIITMPAKTEFPAL